MNKEQLQNMKTHPGFIAALDQSGGSTPAALRAYGIKDTAWSARTRTCSCRTSDLASRSPSSTCRASTRRRCTPTAPSSVSTACWVWVSPSCACAHSKPIVSGIPAAASSSAKASCRPCAGCACPGDTLFAIGAVGFVIFVFGLRFGYSLKDKRRPAAGAADRSVRA
jgi:hypothetical protein